MKLQYLPINQTWVFTLGTQIVRLGNYEMFYDSKRDAVNAASHFKLTVDRKGQVR